MDPDWITKVAEQIREEEEQGLSVERLVKIITSHFEPYPAHLERLVYVDHLAQNGSIEASIDDRRVVIHLPPMPVSEDFLNGDGFCNFTLYKMALEAWKETVRQMREGA